MESPAHGTRTTAVAHKPCLPTDVSQHPKPHPSGETMKAATWHGKHSIKLEERPRPTVTDPADAVLRVTSTCICGSDLHLYEGYMAGMKKGDVLGHEFMGIVEEVGPDVRHIKPGDRVIACFDIACGACSFCASGLYSSCDTTNPSAAQEAVYGQRTGGFFGYSHLLGAYDGGQAEFVRVPFADTNCLVVPRDERISDEQVVLLSDILPTAWHANEMGEVGKGKNVAIWGAGPVGILAAHVAFHRGAARVVLIDREQYRLDFAQKAVPGVEVINFKNTKVDAELRAKFPDYGGPDVAIEAVGMHYAKTLIHAVEQKLSLETDPSDVLNELIRCVRKGGVISVVGAYAAFTNHFLVGGFMEKGLTMRGGQTPVQKYWPILLPKVLSGELVPSAVITHILPLEDVPRAYRIFNDKNAADGCIKVVLKPALTSASPAPAAV